MNSKNNLSQTYLKTINNQLTCIINYAKRYYDLNTNPCGKAGSIGKSKAEEMDFWTYEEYIAFREGIKDKPLSYICFQVLYWTGMREGCTTCLDCPEGKFRLRNGQSDVKTW